MNSKHSRFFALSVSVIFSAFFLGGCVIDNGITESEGVVGDGEEAIEGELEGELEAPGSEAQWVWADFCAGDADEKEKEAAGCVRK